MTPLLIQELPAAERPRERLERLGGEALRDAELLAILLRTGMKGVSAVVLAEGLLRRFGTIEALSRATVSQLAEIKGMGRTKAVQIAAAFALGARARRHEAEARGIYSGADIEALLGDEMRMLPHESVRVVLLNTKHRVLGVHEVARGTINEAALFPREVFKLALTGNAHGVILVHNHPSGDSNPSFSDCEITHRLKALGGELGVPLVDHVIIGSGREGGKRYYSFAEKGAL